MSKSKKAKPNFAPSKITRFEFCATHFNAEQFPTDTFYIGVANKIYPIVHKVFSTQPAFTDRVSRRMAIVLACYIEDLVSGTGVWAAFTSLHKKKYGKKFPFYNLRESVSTYPYDDEFPSFHAVLFLLWYVTNDVNRETVLNPNNPALRMLAMSLMPELVKAYEDAPDTPSRPMIMPEEEIGVPVFYQIRRLCAWLCDRCYLTRINDKETVTEDFEDFINNMFQSVGNKEAGARSYALESFIPMNAKIGPLAIPAYEWLAEIIAVSHEPEEKMYIPILASIQSRPYEYYRYETVGESTLTLLDSNGETLTLSASTMPGNKFGRDIAPGKSALLSLVHFDGVWLMNGIGMHGLAHEVFDECQKTLLEKKKQRKDTYKYLLKAFGKQHIGVCKSYEEFMKLAYGDNDSEANCDPKIIADIRDAGNLLYFLNQDGTITLLPGWGSSVKIKDNPYYDEEEAKHDGLALIFNHSLSTPEMRNYIIKNKLIPDAALTSVISPEAGRELFQNNISFFNDYSDRDTMPFVADI